MTRALRYAFDEAIISLWRGRRTGILSTATIAVALFVLGGFLLVTSNLERLGTELGRSAEMSVYVDDLLTGSDREALEQRLRDAPQVASYEFVSKAEALARFRSTFADLGGAVDTLDDNPLPASFEVQLRTDGGQAAVDALATELREAPGVTDVRYDRQWLDRLQSAVGVIRGVGLGLAAVLTLAAALTVATVVRLALYARRDEIEIMQLVGAPRAYIRGPFVMEGVIQGGVGSALALAALAAAFLVLRGPYLLPLAGAVNLPSVGFLAPELCLALVAGGMLVGCVGGLVASGGA